LIYCAVKGIVLLYDLQKMTEKKEKCRMKNRLFCLLLSITLLLGGCISKTSKQPAEDVFVTEEKNVSAEIMQEEDADVPTLEEYVSELDVLDTPSREYGESSTYIHMDDELVVRILYPSVEIPSLKEEIERWINETVGYYIEEAAGSSEYGEAAELTVEYESYLVNEKYAGIKMTGVFDMPFLAHPVDLAATFNADIEKNGLIEIGEILLPDGEGKLTEMAAEKAGVVPEDIDENFLENWTVKHEGIEVILERGKYLPMSDGTKTVLFSYSELEEILVNSDDWKNPGLSGDLTDTSGNTVYVSAEETVAEEEKPMVALTFDDGPSAQTARLLDLFAEHGGKGTFFLVGNMIDKRSDVVIRMVNEGHEVGNHSWNHRQFTKLGEQELTDQIMTTRAKIYDVTGVDTTILRPPYGSYNDVVSAKAEELGIAMVNWSVDTLDWKNKNADSVYNSVMKDVQDGSIILCHDLYSTTVDAMERVIPDLIEQGYRLVTVTELLTSDEGEIEAGKLYRKK